MKKYPITQLPSRHISIDGETWLYYSGTGYLGISSHPLFQQFLQEGIQQYGTNYGGSRRSNTPLQIFEEAEQYLAELCQAPAALTLSSGTLAGRLVATLQQEKGPHYCSPNTHPAIYPFTKINDAVSHQEWIEQLISTLEKENPECCTIYSNALDPLYATTYDWAWLEAIPKACRFTLVLDDSHGLGLRGKNGSGIYPQLKAFSGEQLIVVASMGKAFGVPAGVVLGEEKMLETVKESAYFGGASPAIPAYLYAFLRAQGLYKEQRRRLQANIRQFIRGVGQTGLFRYIDHYPVFYTPHNQLATFLQKRKIMVSSFPYPQASDDCITRIVLSSCHEPEDIDFLAEQVLEFYHTLET